MKSSDWKSTAELFGIAAIVASLVFVGLQMRQSQSIAMSDGNLANASNKIERNIAIVENSEVWVRGNTGQKLDENDSVVFRYLVQTYVDTAFFEIVRLRRLGEDEIADSLVADFSVFLFENPGARQIWKEDELKSEKYRTFLSGSQIAGRLAFAESVNRNLSSLDQSAK
ncbi:MAG: hypothetical protein ACI88G_001159 [Woeseiaceae bacterium]|jgi:hypothetical protein